MFPPQILSYQDRLIEEKAKSLGEVKSEEEACDLAGRFGIIVYYQRFLSRKLRGLLVQEEGYSAMIAVDKKLPYCERVFVILHELGHYVLHRINVASLLFMEKSVVPLCRLEREADIFAWSLMSEKLREGLFEDRNYLDEDTVEEQEG